jgi:hypothetical protein
MSNAIPVPLRKIFNNIENKGEFDDSTKPSEPKTVPFVTPWHS